MHDIFQVAVLNCFSLFIPTPLNFIDRTNIESKYASLIDKSDQAVRTSCLSSSINAQRKQPQAIECDRKTDRRTFCEPTEAGKKIILSVHIVISDSVQVYTSTSDESEPSPIDSSLKSYLVEYGPICVRHRRSQSQTLATGRRSKDTPRPNEDPVKSEMRRTRNRLAARELKKTRDNIEMELLKQIRELEQQKDDLHEQHKQLEQRKASLNRAIYNAKLAPLVPLIMDIDIPILFGPKQRRDLLIDLRPLLESIEDQ